VPARPLDPFRATSHLRHEISAKRSAVSFLAVEDALDPEIVASLPEEHTMVLSAQADHGRGHALELFGRAFSGEDVTA
jgi:hypothetical protein